jgi:hypothetical protein
MKLMIFIGVTLGGGIGSWLGAAALDHGNYLGGWSILLGGVGSLVGVWAGYKVGRDYLN